MRVIVPICDRLHAGIEQVDYPDASRSRCMLTHSEIDAVAGAGDARRQDVSTDYFVRRAIADRKKVGLKAVPPLDTSITSTDSNANSPPRFVNRTESSEGSLLPKSAGNARRDPCIQVHFSSSRGRRCCKSDSAKCAAVLSKRQCIDGRKHWSAGSLITSVGTLNSSSECVCDASFGAEWLVRKCYKQEFAFAGH